MPLAGAYAPTSGPLPSALGPGRFDIVESEFWTYFHTSESLFEHNMKLFGNASISAASTTSTSAVDCNMGFGFSKEQGRPLATTPFYREPPGCKDLGMVQWPEWDPSHSEAIFGIYPELLLPYYLNSFLSSGPLGSLARNRYGVRMTYGSDNWTNLQVGVDRNNLAPDSEHADQMSLHYSGSALTGYISTNRWYNAGTLFIPLGRQTGWGTRTKVNPSVPPGTIDDLLSVSSIDSWNYDLWIREFRAWPAALTPEAASDAGSLIESVFELVVPIGYGKRLSASLALNLMNWTQEFWHGGTSPDWAVFKGDTRWYLGGLRHRSASLGWIDCMTKTWTTGSGVASGGTPSVGWGVSPRIWSGTNVVLFGHTNIDEFRNYDGGNENWDWTGATSETPLITIPAIEPIDTAGDGSRSVKQAKRRKSLRERRKQK